MKEARFDRLIQEQTLAGFQIGLINKVKAAFYENVMQQRNVEFSQEILEISQGILNLITSRFKIGLSAEMDVMTAGIEMNRSRQAVLSSITALGGARKKLKVLLGIVDQISVTDRLEVERVPIKLSA